MAPRDGRTGDGGMTRSVSGWRGWLMAFGAAVLASGAGAAAAVAVILVLAPDRPPGWEGVRVILTAGGLGFAAGAVLALVPALLGVIGLAVLRRRGRRPGVALSGAVGAMLGLATLWLVLGALVWPLWAAAGLAGLAAGTAAQGVLMRVGAEPA